jgi:hypothetical protein
LRTPIGHQKYLSDAGIPGTKIRVGRCSRQSSPRDPRQRGGYAMWTSLFAVTIAIAIALSMAAIVVESANGGKFRL